MDLEKLFADIETVVMGESDGEDYDFTLTLSKDLHYYTKTGVNETAARIIPAGTKVQVLNNAPYAKRISGYGINSLPTYDRDWRYARSFLTAEEAEGQTIKETADDTYYYIKTRELYSAAEDFLKQYEASLEIPEGKTKKTYIQEIFDQQMYGIDKTMLAYGIFESPALTKPIMDDMNIILLFVVAAATAGGIILLKVRQLSKS